MEFIYWEVHWFPVLGTNHIAVVPFICRLLSMVSVICSQLCHCIIQPHHMKNIGEYNIVK